MSVDQGEPTRSQGTGTPAQAGASAIERLAETPAEPSAATVIEQRTESAAERSADTAVEPPVDTAAAAPGTAAEQPTDTAAGEPTETAVEQPAETAAGELAETAVEKPADTAGGELAETAGDKPADAEGGELAETAGDKPGETAAGPDGKTAVEVPAAAGDWTHFAPEPEAVPGRPMRLTRRVGWLLGHEWTLVCLAALVLAVVMTWPSALHPATTIPSDIWDPTLQAWQLAWSGHAMLTDPAQLWNSNSFFPDSYSFAFSDTLFGYFPAGLIGSGPTAALVRYNVLFILLHALAFVGGYALVRQLGVRSAAAAAVAGAAFAYAPWRWSQAGHMHVLSVGGIALSLAMLARGHGFSLVRGSRAMPAEVATAIELDQPGRPAEVSRPARRWRPGWALAGWCTAAWQITLGFGIGLPFAYVLLGICLVTVIRWLLRGRRPVSRRLLVFDAVGLVIFALTCVFMGLPYLEVIRLHPEAVRSLADVQFFSPPWRAFLIAPPQSLPWGAAHAAVRDANQSNAETTLLPGFMLLGLATAGLFISVWSLRTRLLLLAGTVLSVILAMGTQFFGGGNYTYVLLYKYLPAFNSSRTPGRLVIWTTLLLAVLAAGAVAALTERSADLARERVPSRPNLVMRLATLLPLLLVLAEGTNWGKLEHPVVPTQPAAMRTVAGPMLVLPSDSLIDENVMLWSTSKFQRIVNGGSGFVPNDQSQVRTIAKSFPDQASVTYLRQIGVRAVVVLKAQAANSDYARAAALDTPIDGLGIDRRDDGDTLIYTIN